MANPIPSGQTIGQSLARSVRGGSNPFENILRGMGRIPAASATFQRMGTLGRIEHDRRQREEMATAEEIKKLANDLSFGGGGSSLSQVLLTQGAPGVGTGAKGSTAAPAGLTGPIQLHDVASRARREQQVIEASERAPGDREPVFITEEEGAKHRSLVGDGGSLHVALEALRTPEVERIERARRSLRPGEGISQADELAYREYETSRDRTIGEIEQAMRIGEPRGLFNPATRIGLPDSTVLRSGDVSKLAHLVASKHRGAKALLASWGVDPDITIEDLRGLAAEAAVYENELAGRFRKESLQRQKTESDTNVAGRSMFVKAQLIGQGYDPNASNLNDLSSEIAKMDDKSRDQIIDDIGRDALFRNRLQIAETESRKEIHQYYHRDGDGKTRGTRGKKGTAGEVAPSVKVLRSRLKAEEANRSKLHTIQAKDGLTAKQQDQLSGHEREINSLQNQLYEATGIKGLRFPTVDEAVSYLWDKRFGYNDAAQFLASEGLVSSEQAGRELLVSTGKSRQSWNKRAETQGEGAEEAPASSEEIALGSLSEEVMGSIRLNLVKAADTYIGRGDSVDDFAAGMKTAMRGESPEIAASADFEKLARKVWSEQEVFREKQTEELVGLGDEVEDDNAAIDEKVRALEKRFGPPHELGTPYEEGQIHSISVGKLRAEWEDFIDDNLIKNKNNMSDRERALLAAAWDKAAQKYGWYSYETDMSSHDILGMESLRRAIDSKRPPYRPITHSGPKSFLDPNQQGVFYDWVRRGKEYKAAG